MAQKDKDFITVLHAPVDGEAKALNIKNTLKMMQTLVGGLIEPVPLRLSKAEWKAWSATAKRLGVPHIKNPILIVNEEGLLHQLPQNPHFPFCVGNVFLMEDKDLK